MSVKKKFRPVLHRYGDVATVQALTGGSSGTQITNHGITTITSTGNGSAGTIVYTIAAPIKGIHKTVICDNNSTKLIQVRTPSSAATFYGSTKNSFTFTTGSTAAPSSVHLVGLTSAQWAIMDISTPLATVTSTAGGTIDHFVTITGATA